MPPSATGTEWRGGRAPGTLLLDRSGRSKVHAPPAPPRGAAPSPGSLPDPPAAPPSPAGGALAPVLRGPCAGDGGLSTRCVSGTAGPRTPWLLPGPSASQGRGGVCSAAQTLWGLAACPSPWCHRFPASAVGDGDAKPSGSAPSQACARLSSGAPTPSKSALQRVPQLRPRPRCGPHAPGTPASSPHLH